MELECKVQNYEWGKKGLLSKVAQLQQSADKDVMIDPHLPYAELWMGTHVNGASIMKNTNEKLSDVIESNPDYLGDDVRKQFNNLPFLFKVLSVDKALSIQAHPAKEYAELLHAERPDLYKDPNHKPEMAIALTEFEALSGFRPWTEIKQFITELPSLKEIVGDIPTNDLELIKKAFRAVLTYCKEPLIQQIDQLLQYLQHIDKSQRDYLNADLVERLHSQYPYDCGILMVYFLNYLKLQPSEAIFLGANEPHAYLSGDCVECMACSDNVVRAGLTPKYIDVDTLCAMLNYEGAPAKAKLYLPEYESCLSRIFRPPVPDFAVVQIEVPAGDPEFSTTSRNSASILLVVSGKASFNEENIVPGKVLFIPAKTVLTFRNIQDNLLLYQAMANV